jgi:endo-1,3-1,4-beta-glycanase ExoK
MLRIVFASFCFLATALLSQTASAVKSPELYSSASYGYGRVEARVRFVAGDGVVGAFFLWKDGSEKEDTFWNELDFEKVGADCHLETNAFYGNPEVVHNQKYQLGDLCAGFHTYTYEWTPDYIAWFVDGSEIRRETGETAAAYAQNATAGMQIHFNVWPGDATFGGNFDPSILPVHQYVDWVEYSSYADGVFTPAWREDFSAATLPANWYTGTWASPKNLSVHDALNVNFINGYAVLSLTTDEAPGPAGAEPPAAAGTGGAAGGMGSGGMGVGGMGGTGQSGATASAGTTAASQSDADADEGCHLTVSRVSGSRGLLGALGVLVLALRRRRRNPGLS